MFSPLRRRVVGHGLALSALLALLAAPLAAQTGSLTGRVTDAASGEPIAAAQVQVAGAGLGAITGEDGVFRIVNVPAGTYTIIIRRLGYIENREAGVEVAAGATTTRNFTLTESGNVLAAIAVSGTRNQPEKVLDAPAQISVISSERIAERPAVTVADNLRTTAGVDINRGGIIQANIVARGFNNAFSGSMLMLQDYRFAGVPSLRVNVPFLFTGTNEDIERMEVLLGPASALYGPNSGNGVLHIITKSPFDSEGTTVSLDGGEQSIIRAGFRHARVLGNTVGVKLSGEFMRGQDFSYTDPSEPNTFSQFAPEERRGQPNNRSFDVEKLTGEARLDWRPTDAIEAVTTAGFTQAGSGIELTGANGSVQVKDWTYFNLQQRFRYNRLFAQAFLNSSNAGNDNGSDASGTYLLRSGQPIVDQSRVAAFQVQHGFDYADRKQTFTYGVDYIWTNPRTANTINGSNEEDDNVTEYGAYLQSQTRPNDKLELLLAGRVDGNNVIDGSFFSPRAALIIKPTPTQNFRVTYNRSFSTPANFTFFLDLIQATNIAGQSNPAFQYDVRALGNRPKEGWQFRRDCDGAPEGLCMRSPFYGGEFGPASAAGPFQALVGGNSAALVGGLTPQLVAALQAQAGLPAAQAQALGAQLAAGLVQHLATRSPTGADVATRLVIPPNVNASVDPTTVRDIAPLRASFSSTYEVGYKGVLGNRATIDVALWRQARGDVGTSALISTPWVFFANPSQLTGYIDSETRAFISTQLQGAGFPAQSAQAFAGAVAASFAPTLGGQLAPAPLGVVSFDSDALDPQSLYATYTTVDARDIWVTGLDLATSFQVSNRLSLEGTYSYLNKNVFENVPGGNGAPLMANAPRNRGSLGARWNDVERGLTLEARTRYMDSYPVNSGVYATNIAFPIPAGNPGAKAGASGGFGQCNPAPEGTFCYEDVPTAFTVDFLLAKKFNLGTQQLTWSINAQNAFDNEVRTFPGVPAIGRLVMTRLQYQF